MSDYERYGKRDMLFSDWHRLLDRRYKFLDIDWVEFCHVCSEPIAVVEIAQDVGQWKPTTVLERLARRSGLPAFCLLYQSNAANQITGARVRRVFPRPTEFKQRTAEQLENLIERIHRRCCTHTWVEESKVLEIARGREVELDAEDLRTIDELSEGRRGA